MYSLQPADLELATSTIVLLIIVAAILQDDVTCTTVGLLVPSGNLSLTVAVLACLIGTLLGDLIWFVLGRWFGPPILSRPPVKWLVKPDQLNKASAFLDRYGSSSIFISRFLPGIRTSLHFVIGTLHRQVARAMAVFTLAALVYVLLIIGFCQVFRNTIDVLGFYDEYGTTALLVAAVAVLFVLWLAKRSMERVAGKQVETPLERTTGEWDDQTSREEESGQR